MRYWLLRLATVALLAFTVIEADRLDWRIDEAIVKLQRLEPTSVVQDIDGAVPVHDAPVRPYPKATSVRMFVGTGEYVGSEPVLVSNTGHLLTPAQRREFESTLFRRVSLGAPLSVVGCFDPHHHFKYYDQAGNLIGQVDVCFCCGNASASPELVRRSSYETFEFKYDELKSFVKRLRYPTNVACEDARHAA